MGKESGFSSLEYESEAISGSIFEGKNDNFESFATTFQLRRKYIVTTIKSGMVVIDQSRAHQRVLYERFLRHSTIKQAISQQLLFPLSLSFSKADIGILKEIMETLIAVGFVFGEIGETAVQVSGVPLLVPESEVGMVLDQLIADCQQEVSGRVFPRATYFRKPWRRPWP